MTDELATAMKDTCALVDEYRAQCLWFLREDYYPQTPVEACRVLESIEKHGDVPAFRKAARLRQWLRQNFNDSSAGRSPRTCATAARAMLRRELL